MSCFKAGGAGSTNLQILVSAVYTNREQFAVRLLRASIACKDGEIRDTKTLNLSRNNFSLQVLVDASRFSPCLINLTRNKNICCGLK